MRAGKQDKTEADGTAASKGDVNSFRGLPPAATEGGGWVTVILHGLSTEIALEQACQESAEHGFSTSRALAPTLCVAHIAGRAAGGGELQCRRRGKERLLTPARPAPAVTP